ncbi:MAG: DUF115 domain-containing protein, partial [Clostridia bacterium]|nr:DUF115 domain-containing protein [Clostridia bacterium]
IRIIKTHSENIVEKLISNYIPTKYGDLKVIINPNWKNENQLNTEKFESLLQKSISIIKADFSVQSHFGKLWTCNFIKNITMFSEKTINHSFSIPNKKTAVVIGAGPSLDYVLKNYTDKSNYYLIATDTALSVLLRNQIKPDCVISIDGQQVSRTHFMHSEDFTDIHFLFDITSNSSAVKSVLKKNGKVSFFISGHPLASCFNKFLNNTLPYLFSGAGTVTITALDFAVKAGFNQIEIIGADFAYHMGKSYTKGTYLDSLYNKDSSKINTCEQIYDKLLFRTELLKENNLLKTQILNSYKESFLEYLSNNNLDYSYNNFTYKCKNKNTTQLCMSECSYNIKNFFSYFVSLSDPEKEMTLV